MANRFAALASDSEEPDASATGPRAGAAKARGVRSKAAGGRARKRRRSASSAAAAAEQAAEPTEPVAKKRRGSVAAKRPAAAAAAPALGASSMGAPQAGVAAPAGESSAPAKSPVGDAQRTLPGGVAVQVLRRAPAGAAVAGRGDVVKLLYDGRLPDKDGRKFDAGEIDFVLGDGSVIPGFQIGVAGMAVGERRLLRIPSRMGYGKKGKRPKVPPNSDLQFDVSLLYAGREGHKEIGPDPDKMRNMSQKRREAAKRRGKKPRPA